MSNMTYPRTGIVKMISFICLFSPLLAALPFVERAFDLILFTLSMPVASGIIANLPIGEEDVLPSLSLSCISAMVLMAYLLSDIPAELMILLSMLAVTSIQAYRFRARYAELRLLFRASEQWNAMLQLFRASCTTLISMMLVASLYASGSVFFSSVLMLLDAALYVLLLYRDYSGQSMILEKSREKEFYGLMKAYSDTESALRSPERIKDARVADMMSRVRRVMEDNRPYLNENFSIHDLASLVFTNKTSLSRAINNSTGMNFRHFINDYRVNYSLVLMEKEPELKVLELSERSGFHNQVSYGMAFKAKMGVTPGEYSMLKKSRLLDGQELSSRDVQN